MTHQDPTLQVVAEPPKTLQNIGLLKIGAIRHGGHMDMTTVMTDHRRTVTEYVMKTHMSKILTSSRLPTKDRILSHTNNC